MMAIVWTRTALTTLAVILAGVVGCLFGCTFEPHFHLHTAGANPDTVIEIGADAPVTEPTTIIETERAPPP